MSALWLVLIALGLLFLRQYVVVVLAVVVGYVYMVCF